jgi:hypothetical protein
MSTAPSPTSGGSSKRSASPDSTPIPTTIGSAQRVADRTRPGQKLSDQGVSICWTASRSVA